jgi:hypothetical protein
MYRSKAAISFREYQFAQGHNGFRVFAGANLLGTIYQAGTRDWWAYPAPKGDCWRATSKKNAASILMRVSQGAAR